jgi:exonuclease VII large subunit
LDQLLRVFQQRMRALRLKLEAAVGESKWRELIEVGEEVGRMREEFVKEEGYREYLLRKEMAELRRKRSLEGRVKEGYIDKIRVVHNLADKLKHEFESKLEEKVKQMEQIYSEQAAERERAYQEEKTLIIEQLKRQHQTELKEINDLNNEKIEELKAELQRVDAEYSDLKEKLIKEKEELINSKPLISYRTFSSLYEGIMGSSKEFTSSSAISLDTRDEKVK